MKKRRTSKKKAVIEHEPVNWQLEQQEAQAAAVTGPTTVAIKYKQVIDEMPELKLRPTQRYYGEVLFPWLRKVERLKSG